MDRRPKRQPRPEIEVENEPELILMNPGAERELSLPVEWPVERREAFYLSFRTIQ